MKIKHVTELEPGDAVLWDNDLPAIVAGVATADDGYIVYLELSSGESSATTAYGETSFFIWKHKGTC